MIGMRIGWQACNVFILWRSW